VASGSINNEEAASFRRIADLDADVACSGHGEPLIGQASARLQHVASTLGMISRHPGRDRSRLAGSWRRHTRHRLRHWPAWRSFDRASPERSARQSGDHPAHCCVMSLMAIEWLPGKRPKR
jgi:hypothetical protein